MSKSHSFRVIVTVILRQGMCSGMSLCLLKYSIMSPMDLFVIQPTEGFPILHSLLFIALKDL